MDLDVRATAAGFAGALAVLAVLARFVGVEDLLASLAMARGPVVAGVVVAAGVWLAAWALALRTVLGALGATVSVPRAVAVYAGVLFANNVTPFGQAGGEPVSALLVSETAGTEYESALAAVASADSINLVPSTALALVGVAHLSTTLAGEGLHWVTVAVVAFAAVLPVAAYAGWTNRRRLESGADRVAVALAERAGSRIPGLEEPTREAVTGRVHGFFESVELVATDRRTLAVSVGFSAVGWLGQAAALWLALYAVGVAAPVAAVLVAVPVGAIAGVTPLPGGLGGVEATLVVVLVALAGVGTVTAAAAVVIHRGAIYWLPTFAGGGVASAVGARRV